MEVRFNDSQCKELERLFSQYYQLESSPSISRINRYIKGTNGLVEYHTDFKLPSGKVIGLDEYLTEPNGLTANITLTDGSEVLHFDRYIHAEAYVVQKFLEEIHVNS